MLDPVLGGSDIQEGNGWAHPKGFMLSTESTERGYSYYLVKHYLHHCPCSLLLCDGLLGEATRTLGSINSLKPDLVPLTLNHPLLLSTLKPPTARSKALPL